MFCYQCEQTAKGQCCTVNGVCGKSAATASLQDELVSAIITLCHSGKQLSENNIDAVIEGLFMTLTNVNFSDDVLKAKTAEIRALYPSEVSVYEPASLWEQDEDIRSLSSTLLFGVKGVAAYTHHCHVLGYREESLNRGIVNLMAALAEEHSVEEWLGLLMECGRLNYTAMELLDKANTETYGVPSPQKVTFTVEPGPFIVISGHDLHDLSMLLEQTEGSGVNVYTHGEMLPAHAYPQFQKYSHLKGNIGTAWCNQQKEFDELPAPILFTTNCIMKPKASYQDRVYTTSVVSFPNTKHIDADTHGHKDFSSIIQQAKALGGYSEAKTFYGMNGGDTTMTGFGHGAILAAAGEVVQAVKDGAIKHFFLVGGCDGNRSSRSYYRDFVKAAPADALILTLACGKYRFNDLDLGKIGNFPRLMDMGQCNDAYGAIKVALALAEAFQCSVNDLPLTLVLSWYEQKAVSIVLTLLSLGVKNIYVGPTIPAFFSKTVLNVLVEKFGVTPISDPESDLKVMLG